MYVKLISYLIAYPIAGCIYGAITRYMANEKGYEGGFWWGFFLGKIGIMIVGVRPYVISPSASGTAPAYKPMYGGALESGSENKSGWTCVCGTKNSYSQNYCFKCRRTRAEAEEKKVACPHCGAKNSPKNTVCFACNRSMTEEPETQQNPVQIEQTAAVEETKTETAKNDSQLPFEQIKQLKEMLDVDAITREEYEQKKKQLLNL